MIAQHTIAKLGSHALTASRGAVTGFRIEEAGRNWSLRLTDIDGVELITIGGDVTSPDCGITPAYFGTTLHVESAGDWSGRATITIQDGIT